VRYSRILESVLIPAYYKARGRKFPRHRDFVERSQWWPPEKIREFQWSQLRLLLQHAFQSVPYYRKKYASTGVELGDIRTREDFAKLPPLSREEINAHRDELCSQSFRGRLIPHATGGSSGMPTRFFITLDSYDWRCAASARAYSWSGYRTGERALYLWGAPVGKVSRFQQAKLDGYRFLRRELVVPTFAQSPEMWQKTFEVALRFRPRFVVGYVSSLQQFGQFLLSRNLVIPSIEAVLAAAEPVHAATRELVADAFKAPLFDTYGSREFMSIATECEHHAGLHIHAENLLVEAEHDGSGEPSELLITDLHNYGMPFIRYRIGDLGLLTDSVCPCGRGLPLIRRIEGRVLEVLRTRDGKTIPGEFFPHLLKDIGEVQEYQVQQRNLEEVVLSVVLSHPLSENSELLLRREFAKVFPSGTRVTIQPVNAIPRLGSGKRRLTIGIGQTA
jgi:phenylacetate-coenzyme A ligase PaaK-like adenylate-forming protein